MANELDKSSLVDFDLTNSDNILSDLVGSPVAVICQKSIYRGVLASVNRNSIVLHKNDKPYGDNKYNPYFHLKYMFEEEVDVTLPLVINLDSVKLVFQPDWCLPEIN